MAVFIQRIAQFVNTDIWALRYAGLPRWRAFLVRVGCALLIAVREFRSNRCPLRASALTFYSLLAVVPVVAMLFGIAKGFGFQQRLERQLMASFSQHETVVKQIVDFSTNLLANTRGGLVAGIGVVLLFWAVIKILGHVELALNDIWQVDRPRTFVRKISDYLSIMLIWPVNFVLSASATAFVAARLAHVSRDGPLEAIGPLLSGLIQLLPIIVFGLFLAFIYITMPNTKVRFLPALIGGIVAGAAYHAAQMVFVRFQIGVASNNAIYGSFAALPLFLVWLQVGWMIVLFGAELGFAAQNADKYEAIDNVRSMSTHNENLLTLAVMHFIVGRFARGEMAPTANKISNALQIPSALTRDILERLVESRLVSPTQPGDHAQATAYQPAGDIARYTIASVMAALDVRRSDVLPIKKTPTVTALSHALDELRTAGAASPANRLLKDL